MFFFVFLGLSDLRSFLLLIQVVSWDEDGLRFRKWSLGRIAVVLHSKGVGSYLSGIADLVPRVEVRDHRDSVATLFVVVISPHAELASVVNEHIENLRCALDVFYHDIVLIQAVRLFVLAICLTDMLEGIESSLTGSLILCFRIKILLSHLF